MALRLRPPTRPRGWYGVLAVLVAGELLCRSGLVPTRALPPPSDVVRTLGLELAGRRLWTDLGSTLSAWAIGLALAGACAVPLGVAIGSSRILRRSVHLLVEFMWPIPPVAFLPVVVLVSGTGLRSAVFLVFVASLWPLLIQTVYGVLDADPIAIETAVSYRIRRTDRFLRVTMPGAAPYLATGFRLASSAALTLAVSAELVLGAPGLGRTIQLAGAGGSISLMYAYILVTGLVGWAQNGLLVRVQHRSLRWHVSSPPLEAGS